MSVLELVGISKSFSGLKVIDDLNFSVPEGSIFGFIGKNGAGKTTTMKMILGLLKPDDGEIFVEGQKVHFGETPTNKVVGYLPDVPEFYSFMNPGEYLSLCGEVCGMKKSEITARTEELLKLVGLQGNKRKIGGFSRGMKQRLGIASALFGRPKLLICDEPTSALDPVGRKEILDILLLAKGDTTVVFSTHILSDVERICDRIGVLDGGKLKVSGVLSDIKDQYRKDVALLEYRGQNKNEALILQLNSAGMKAADDGANRLLFTLGAKENLNPVMEFSMKSELDVIKLELCEPSLENLFLEAVR